MQYKTAKHNRWLSSDAQSSNISIEEGKIIISQCLLRGDHDRVQRSCSVEKIGRDGSQGGRERNLPQATAIVEGILEIHHNKDCHL